MGMMISHDMLLGRWRLSLELFGRVFMEDVGAEPGSVHLKKIYLLKCRVANWKKQTPPNPNLYDSTLILHWLTNWFTQGPGGLCFTPYEFVGTCTAECYVKDLSNVSCDPNNIFYGSLLCNSCTVQHHWIIFPSECGIIIWPFCIIYPRSSQSSVALR